MKIPVNLKSTLAVLCLAWSGGLNVTALAATATIANPTSTATVWQDTAGNEIINFGGNVLLEAGTFYWYGWNKYAKTVQVYSSTTLASNSWQRRATLISDGAFHGRPDVIKHPTNGTYVMIVKCPTPSAPGRDGIQYYTATNPIGPFTLQLQENQVMNGSGGWVDMGDKGIYQDDDANKTAYLLCTTDDGGNVNGTTKVVKLNANYIGQNAVLQSWTVTTGRREAQAMFKRNGTYYLSSSATSGWNSSSTSYKTSSSLTGTFSALTTMPTNPFSSNSFNTQHDFILKIVGTSVTSYIYLGDRFSQDTGVGYGRCAWYPLTFDGSGVPTIQGDTTWTINAVTGVINGAPQTVTVAAAKDSMVKFAAPTSNFGTSNQLQASNQNNFQKQIFVQFNIATIPSGATVTGSNLLITSQTGGSGRSIMAHAVGNTTWSETGITWNNKPALGATLATVSTHVINADSNWDLGTHITGNGNVTIGLDSGYLGDTNFHSREATTPANRPELVITYQP